MNMRMKIISLQIIFLLILTLTGITRTPLNAQEIRRDLVPVEMKKFTLMIDVGMGNIASLYATYAFHGINLGIGCGYLFYTDPDSEITINTISPNLILYKTFARMFLFRQRLGLDLIAKKGGKFKQTSYVASSDLMVKVIKLKESSLCAGVSLPIVFGNGTADFDTVVGVTYLVGF